LISYAVLGAVVASAGVSPVAANARVRLRPVTLDTSRFPRQVEVPGGTIGSFHIHGGWSSMDSNGDQNPYGIAVAQVTVSGVSAGTVFVCNFNNSSSLNNIQSLGTTIEEINPYASSPRAVTYIRDERITGCNALAINSGNRLFTASYASNLVYGLRQPIDWSNSEISPSTGWTGPWGIAYDQIGSTNYLYVGGGYDGGLWRYSLSSSGATYTEICTNFYTNHGVPGTLLGPSGFSYDTVHDILYMVEGYSNSLIRIVHPWKIPAGGLIRTPYGFGGTYASYATVLSQGGYINAPISTTVLPYDGHVLVENTGDNYVMEFGSDGSYYGRYLLDTSGTPGALFGITTYGTTLSNTRIYYNDDNTNALYYLSQS
jgi:hypothetical protein